jgi:hypothetical protein
MSAEASAEVSAGADDTKKKQRASIVLRSIHGFMTLPSPLDGHCLYSSIARSMAAWIEGADDAVAVKWFAKRLTEFGLSSGVLRARGGPGFKRGDLASVGPIALRRLVAMQFLIPHVEYDDIIDSMRSMLGVMPEEFAAVACLPEGVPTAALTEVHRIALFRAIVYNSSYWGNTITLTFLERVFVVRFLPFDHTGTELRRVHTPGAAAYPPVAYLVLALVNSHYRMLAYQGDERLGMFSRLALETDDGFAVLRPVLEDDDEPADDAVDGVTPYTPYESHVKACYKRMIDLGL